MGTLDHIEHEDLGIHIGNSWFEERVKRRQGIDHTHLIGRGLKRVMFVCLTEGNCFDTNEEMRRNASKLHDYFTTNSVEAGALVLLANKRGETVPRCAIGFLEISGESEIKDCMNTLNELSGLGFKSIRILLVDEDCSGRIFPPFRVYFACPPNEEVTTIQIGNGTNTFNELFTNIFNLGQLLRDNQARSKNPEQGCFTLLEGDERKSVPSSERISIIAQSCVYPSLLECKELLIKDEVLLWNSMIDWDEVTHMITRIID